MLRIPHCLDNRLTDATLSAVEVRDSKTTQSILNAVLAVVMNMWESLPTDNFL
jgi:hypothetical protein